MSLAVRCPNCGTESRFALLSTIDAQRAPDVRKGILDRTLQRTPCGTCGTAVRPPPAFMYFDRRCGLWVSAHAWSNRAAWQEWEDRARTNFQTVFESGSSIGRQMHAGPVRARVTFGWEGLREKIVAAEHGIDDVGLELWKHRRATSESEPASECRLVSVSAGQVVLATVAPDSEVIIEETRVPQNVFEQTRTGAADRAVRSILEQGLYVDVRRLATSG